MECEYIVDSSGGGDDECGDGDGYRGGGNKGMSPGVEDTSWVDYYKQ